MVTITNLVYSAATHFTPQLLTHRVFTTLALTHLPDCQAARGRGKKGQYAISKEWVERQLQKRGAYGEKERLIKGFYNESLTPELQKELSKYKARVILIDSDLYESAKQALDFMKPMIQRGTVIVFDDWASEGERQAFAEFQSNFSLLFEDFPIASEKKKAFVAL